MSKKISHQKMMEKHTRKQQLRKVKPKNNYYKKGPRKRDWLDEDWDEMEGGEDERVIPRGESERRRQREKQLTTQQGQPKKSTPPQPASKHGEKVFKGVVTAIYSQNCEVQIGQEVWTCALRGSLRGQENGFSNPLAVGDRVRVSQVGVGKGVVEEALPRRNVLARRHVKNPALRQAVAANIDRVLIVQAWRQPNFWPELVDRYLIAAQLNGLQSVICVNKMDLMKNKTEFDEAVRPYRALGLQVLETSATNQKGIKDLRKMLANSTTVLAGLSGVGKSSLITAVQPDLDLEALTVGVRGKNKNQGRHTTSSSTLYTLDNGSLVIDTPGIREFGLTGLRRGELSECYPEMVKAARNCQYANCSHIHEPGCGVREGVGAGQVSQARYDNYVKIYECLRDA